MQIFILKQNYVQVFVCEEKKTRCENSSIQSQKYSEWKGFILWILTLSYVAPINGVIAPLSCVFIILYSPLYHYIYISLVIYNYDHITYYLIFDGSIFIFNFVIFIHMCLLFVNNCFVIRYIFIRGNCAFSRQHLTWNFTFNYI